LETHEMNKEKKTLGLVDGRIKSSLRAKKI
jgi:hypothetical protein